jgi:nitrogen fixation protein FixH
MRYIIHIIVTLMLALTLVGCGGSSGFQGAAETASYTVKLNFTNKLTLGNHTAAVEVVDRSGQPIQAEKVVVTPLMESMGMASPESTAKLMDAGRYQAENVYFSMLGDWEVDVLVRADGKEEKARFAVQVVE